jgi:hypothetical protein
MNTECEKIEEQEQLGAGGYKKKKKKYNIID